MARPIGGDPPMTYDLYAPIFDRPIYHADAARLTQWVLGIVRRPPARVLDLCCGAGITASILAGRGYHVTGVDVSVELLRRAEARCAGLDVRLIASDLARDAPPVTDESFDVVTCLNDSVNHLATSAEIEHLVGIAYAALRPGGWLLFDGVDPSALERASGMTSVEQDDDDAFEVVERAATAGEPSMTIRSTSFVRDRATGGWTRSAHVRTEWAHDREKLKALLARAGFGTISVAGDPPASIGRPPVRWLFAAQRRTDRMRAQWR